MALRISSAEIVSSAMALASSSAGVLWWSGRSVGRAGSAGQPPAGGLESVGDGAVDDLVVDPDDETPEHLWVDQDLQAHGPPVHPLERGDQALLLSARQRHR